MIEEFYASHIKRRLIHWRFNGSWLRWIPSLYSVGTHLGMSKLVDARLTLTEPISVCRSNGPSLMFHGAARINGPSTITMISETPPDLSLIARQNEQILSAVASLQDDLSMLRAQVAQLHEGVPS
jgi:hypothetical protein